MKDLRKISVVGMGLLGSSVSLALCRVFPGLCVSGFSHRAQTRQKARKMQVASVVEESMEACVKDADLVILATPIRTFEGLFKQMRPMLKPGCIVTDVGSTKKLPHQWAARIFKKAVHYVGSHPIAGSEKRGVEFARDDLLAGARCIVTKTAGTNPAAVATLVKLWKQLGCNVQVMSPQRHDRIFGHISHLPHITAASLVNANDPETLRFAGKGFIDTSRVASSPANIWTDILLTNPVHTVEGIDRLIAELKKIRTAIAKKDEKKIELLLEKARAKRQAMIEYKIRRKELF
jgi:prephenate dehydrogenase